MVMVVESVSIVVNRSRKTITCKSTVLKNAGKKSILNEKKVKTLKKERRRRHTLVCGVILHF